MTAPTVDRAAGLRRAAALLDVSGQRGAVRLPTWAGAVAYVQLPAEVARPLALWLRACAEDIDRHRGRILGLPVSYALQVAGALLGEDLGHNR